ncbi:unnamed protein product [Chrysoparadoxa australica]
MPGDLSLPSHLSLFHYFSSPHQSPIIQNPHAALCLSQIPFSKLRLVIVVYQILPIFAEVTNTEYPGSFDKFVKGIGFLNFDLVTVSCLVSCDFYQRLLFSTLTPIMLLLVLYIAYKWTGRKLTTENEVQSRKLRKKHEHVALFITFYVYGGASTTILQVL